MPPLLVFGISKFWLLIPAVVVGILGIKKLALPETLEDPPTINDPYDPELHQEDEDDDDPPVGRLVRDLLVEDSVAVSASVVDRASLNA